MDSGKLFISYVFLCVEVDNKAFGDATLYNAPEIKSEQDISDIKKKVAEGLKLKGLDVFWEDIALISIQRLPL